MSICLPLHIKILHTSLSVRLETQTLVYIAGYEYKLLEDTIGLFGLAHVTE